MGDSKPPKNPRNCNSSRVIAARQFNPSPTKFPKYDGKLQATEQSRATRYSRGRSLFFRLIWVYSCVACNCFLRIPFPRRVRVRPKKNRISLCRIWSDGGRALKSSAYQSGVICSNDGASPTKKGYKANKRKKRRRGVRRRKWSGLGTKARAVVRVQAGGLPLMPTLPGFECFFKGGVSLAIVCEFCSCVKLIYLSQGISVCHLHRFNQFFSTPLVDKCFSVKLLGIGACSIGLQNLPSKFRFFSINTVMNSLKGCVCSTKNVFSGSKHMNPTKGNTTHETKSTPNISSAKPIEFAGIKMSFHTHMSKRWSEYNSNQPPV